MRWNFIDNGEPDAIDGARLSPDLLRFLGVQPNMGRGFASDEGLAPVGLISDTLWRSRYGGDTDIIGRALRLDGQVFTVIGVMPASFRFPDARAEYWVPLDPRDTAARSAGRLYYLSMVARL